MTAKQRQRDPLKSDFRNFLYAVFRHLGLPSPTPIQYDIAYTMQHGGDRLVIEAFRGIGKSYIAAIYAIWKLYCNPHLHVIVLSATKPRADAFSTFCLRIIEEMPELAELRPGPGQRRSVIAFDVGPAGAAQTPSMMSIGIFGQATGFRGDLVIKDDIEIPNNSETQLQREKLRERSREAPGALLKPGGQVIVLGTPQSDDSIYNDYPERGYRVMLWPSEYPTPLEVSERSHMFAPWILDQLAKDPQLAGHSTEPTRFPDEELHKRKLEYGAVGYSLQFKLNTKLSDADKFPLKVKDLIVFPLDLLEGPEKLIYASLPDNVIENVPNVAMAGDRYYRGVFLPNTAYRKWERTIMYIDPAGRGKDETAYAVGSSLCGKVFLRDSGAFKGYEKDTLVELCKIAKKYGVHTIRVEPNFGDGMFLALMQPVLRGIYQCGIEEDDWQTGQKEKRICDVLEPVVTSHRLVVDEQLISKDFESVSHMGNDVKKFYRLFYQFTHITRDKGALKHDDRLDAVAGMVRSLQSVLSSTEEDLVAKAREEDLDRSIREFIDRALDREEGQRRTITCPWA